MYHDDLNFCHPQLRATDMNTNLSCLKEQFSIFIINILSFLFHLRRRYIFSSAYTYALTQHLFTRMLTLPNSHIITSRLWNIHSTGRGRVNPFSWTTVDRSQLEHDKGGTSAYKGGRSFTSVIPELLKAKGEDFFCYYGTDKKRFWLL